jgi:hypothetical protein
MRIRHLANVADVIEAIGSLRLQEITDKRTNNVSNWKAAGRFPPETYVAIQAELKAIGCRAPIGLWRMIEPKKRSRAA